MLETKTALRYDEALEAALNRIENLLKADYGISSRSIGLLLLQGDPDIENRVREHEDADYEQIQEIVSQARQSYSQPLSYIIALRRQQEVKRLLSTVGRIPGGALPKG